MGSLISRQIIQTRTWIDPDAPLQKDLNYNEVFPITTFDAVRDDINDTESKTLRELLDDMLLDIHSKQQVLPALPANHLVTYAGQLGKVSSIMMSTDIPWDESMQSHDKIATEKAVANFINKLGIDPENPGAMIRWSDIIGRPMAYHSLGDNDNGFVVQNVLTESITDVTKKVDDFISHENEEIDSIGNELTDHQNNFNNPHRLTLDILNGISKQLFELHTNNYDNPHAVKKDQIGLGNVDNTSDKDKPISDLVQFELNEINEALASIGVNVGTLKFFVNVEYLDLFGTLSFTLNDNSTISVIIPINQLVDEIRYDSFNNDLVYTEYSGEERRVDLSELYIRYNGGNTKHINITIDGNQYSGNQIINATINPFSIQNTELGDYSVSNRTLQSDSVKTANISKNAVTGEKISPNSITGNHITYRSITGDKLFSSQYQNRILAVRNIGESPSWQELTGRFIPDNTIERNHIKNDSINSDKIQDASITGDKIRNGSIETEHLSDDCITKDKISNNSIDGDKIVNDVTLFGTPKSTMSPPLSSKSNQIPDTYWVKSVLEKVKIVTDNISDRSITGKQLFSSDEYPRILAVTSKNGDAKWSLVQDGMIENRTITSDKLVDECVTSDKLADDSIRSNHFSLHAIDNDAIADHAVEPRNLQPYAIHHVLATIHGDVPPVYTKVLREMIDPRAIDSERIDYGVTLPGQPRLDIRPSILDSDANGNGSLIPDVQWVLDAIKKYSGGVTPPEEQFVVTSFNVSTNELPEQGGTIQCYINGVWA